MCCCCQRLVPAQPQAQPPLPWCSLSTREPIQLHLRGSQKGLGTSKRTGRKSGITAFVRVDLNGNALGLWAPGDAWVTSEEHPLCYCTHLALLQQQLLESMPWSDPTCQIGRTDGEGRKRTPAPAPTASSKPCWILSTKNHISGYLHSLNTNQVYFTPLCIFFSNYSLLLQRTSHVSLDLRRIF